MDQGAEVYFTEEDVGSKINVDGQITVIGKSGNGNLALIMRTGPSRISRTYAGCIEGFPIIRLNGISYRTRGNRAHFYPGFKPQNEPDTYESLLPWLENAGLV